MANMEFLKANFLNTTTMVVSSTGSGTFANLFDRNDNLAWASVGHDADTTTTLSIEFGQNVVLSSIILKNHNLKDFRVFYNSATANTFPTDVNVTGNSLTSSYFNFASTTVSSITLQMDASIPGNDEFKVGELIPTERRIQFDVNPAHRNYNPSVRLTKIIHRMPDGGKTAFNIRNKFRASIDLEFIGDSFHSGLEQVYDESLPIIFVPFPTTGSDWDGRAHEVIWTNDFNFTFGDNSKTQGRSGEIVIEETPNA